MKRGLNIGSGQRPFTTIPGEFEWANVDKYRHPGMPEPDWYADAEHLPCADESADYVVFHHVIEHFGCGEAAGAMQEAARVLKSGGSLIVTVPNMRELAKGWLGGKISTQIYFTNVYGAYMGSEGDRHRWGFDHDSLREFLLSTVHWAFVMPFDFRPIPGADIAQDWWILGCECVR